MPAIAELERVSLPRPAAFRRAVFDAWKWGYSGPDAMFRSLLLLCAGAHEGEGRGLRRRRVNSRPIAKQLKSFEHLGLDQRLGEAGGSLPEATPVGALSRPNAKSIAAIRNVRFTSKAAQLIEFCPKSERIAQGEADAL
jgi:hypothetical protein